MKNKILLGALALILILGNSTTGGEEDWYYKPGYPDYCNFGIPDFDQKQDGWFNTAGQWNHCGPVALANCFWWFDSKYDTSTTPPPDSIDTYPLVRAYGSGDDHDTSNVPRLVNQLAACMGTDSAGTSVFDMEDCITAWVVDAGLAEDFHESTYARPSFRFIENQVKMSQDVILLLGFYQHDDENCWRIGGHFVTVAGVNSVDSMIAISDPFYDINEGVITPHDSSMHNDADSVSGPHGTNTHDILGVVPTLPPCEIGGNWMLSGYPDLPENFFGQNENPDVPTEPYVEEPILPIITVVEYAVVICPRVCPPDEFSVTTGPGRFDLSEFTGVKFEAEAGRFDSLRADSIHYSTYPVTYFSGEVAYWPATSPNRIWLRNDSGNPTPQYGGPGVEWIDFDFTAIGDTLYYCEFGVQFAWSDANDGWADIYINYNFSQPIASVNTKNLQDNWLCVKGLPVPVNHVRVAQRGGSPGADHVSVDYVVAPNPPAAEIPEYPGWYFKPPDHAKPESSDYAPSGMPDFDQNQDNWKKEGNYTFCGPVAVANCFWWFDSKYQNPKGTPGDGWDRFPLVRDYLDTLSWRPAGWTLTLPAGSPAKQDDHRYDNPDHPGTQWPPSGGPPALPHPFIPGDQGPPLSLSPWGELVERLAEYMNTDSSPSSLAYGTNVHEMEKGIRRWLYVEGLSGFFDVQKINAPSFPYIDDEVRASEDVILLLGFWEYSEGDWHRVGGHFVTVAGIYFEGDEQKIALSDPYIDWAERGGAGIIRNSPWSPHPAGVHTSEFHNDPGNASHDFYGVSAAAYPQAGKWQLDVYPVGSHPFVEKFDKQNFPEELVPEYGEYNGDPVSSIVEYAIVISPRGCPFIKELWIEPYDENLRGEQDLLPGDSAEVCLRIHNVDTESCFLDSAVFFYSKISPAYGTWVRLGEVSAETELLSADSVTLCQKYHVPATGHGGIKSILYSDCCPLEPEVDFHNVWTKHNSDCNDKRDTFEIEILTPNQLELEIIEDLPAHWDAAVSPSTLLPGLNKLRVVMSADSEYVEMGQRASVRVISVFEDQVVGEATFIKEISFIPGDVNADSTVDVSDIDFLIRYLFRRGARPLPIEAADANANGVVNMADVTYLIHFIYRNGDPPPCE